MYNFINQNELAIYLKKKEVQLEQLKKQAQEIKTEIKELNKLQQEHQNG